PFGDEQVPDALLDHDLACLEHRRVGAGRDRVRRHEVSDDHGHLRTGNRPSFEGPARLPAWRQPPFFVESGAAAPGHPFCISARCSCIMPLIRSCICFICIICPCISFICIICSCICFIWFFICSIICIICIMRWSSEPFAGPCASTGPANAARNTTIVSAASTVFIVYLPLTVRTGHVALATTRPATLPSSSLARPERPWVPSTIRSARLDLAKRTICSWATPSRTNPFARTPPCFAFASSLASCFWAQPRVDAAISS